MEIPYHFIFLSFTIAPLLVAIFRGVSLRKQETSTEPRDWPFVLNVSLIYVLSWTSVYFIQELFLVLGKNWLGLTSYLYNNNHYWDGEHPMTDLLQGSGALSILIFGILMAIIHFLIKGHRVPALGKVTIWFMAIQGLLQSISQVQTAFVAVQTDVGRAMSYLGLGGGEGYVITVLACGLVALIVWLAIKEYLKIGIFTSENEKSGWINIFNYLILPVLIGTVLIVPYMIFPWSRAAMHITHLIVWIPWVLAFGFMEHRNKASVRPGLNPYLIISAVILLLCFRLILAPGIVFTP